MLGQLPCGVLVKLLFGQTGNSLCTCVRDISPAILIDSIRELMLLIDKSMLPILSI